MKPIGTRRQRIWLKASPQQRIKLAEQLGDNGARIFAKNHKWIPVFDGTSRNITQGPDQVYRDLNGNIHVIEAKGGSSPLRQSYGHAQGSITWAIESAKRVLRHHHASQTERQGAIIILEAAANRKLQVHVIRTLHVLGEPTTIVLEQTVISEKKRIMKTLWILAIGFCLICGTIVLLFGINKFRWFATGQINSTKEQIWDAVSLDSKLRMANAAHKEIQPLVVKYTKQVVLAELDVDKVQAKVREYETGMEYSKSQILKEKTDLDEAIKNGKQSLTYADVEHTLPEIEQDLAQKFAVYEANELVLKNLRQELVSRQTALDNYNNALQNTDVTTRKLGSEIALLQARLEAVKTTPTIILDSTTKELETLLTDIDASITAAERVSKMSVGNFNGGIKIPDPQATDDMLKKIDEKFKK